MPFTIAHAAAVVPLRRPLGKAGVLSALVIGSMSPDFAYFLPGSLGDFDSHSLGSIFWFCIPIGLIAYCVFHFLLAPALVPLLPRAFQRRLPARLARGVPPEAGPVAVVSSLLVGTVTHIGWDLFTHFHTPVVSSVPFLRALLFEIGGYRLFVYNSLQHASSLAGLGLLAWWIGRWYRRTSPCHEPGSIAATNALRAIAALSIVLIPAAAGLWSCVSLMGDRQWLAELHRLIGYAIFEAGTYFGAGLLALGLICRTFPSLRRGPLADADHSDGLQ